MSNKTKLEIKIDPTKVARGHRKHTTGSGRHKDKRNKRCRTRKAKLRRALKEQGY